MQYFKVQIYVHFADFLTEKRESLKSDIIKHICISEKVIGLILYCFLKTAYV